MTCALERVRVTDLGCEGTGELESQPGRPKVGHGCKSVAMSSRFTHSDIESLGRYAIFVLLCGCEKNPSPGFLERYFGLMNRSSLRFIHRFTLELINVTEKTVDHRFLDEWV